jgi:hypothetical protein
MERTGNCCPHYFREMVPVSEGKTTLAVDYPIPRGLPSDVGRCRQDLLPKAPMGGGDCVVTMVLLG